MPSDDPDQTIRVPPAAGGGVPSPWINPHSYAEAPPPPSSPPMNAVRHSYPLAVRDAGLGTAIGLLMRSLPYALVRFAVLLGTAVTVIIVLSIAFGGAAWLGTHIAAAFGWVWLFLVLGSAGWVWATVVRYVLHLIECGHIAVLTELITRGQVGNGTESMFAYGRRVVTERFGQVSVLFGLNAVVRGIVGAFHRTLDWIADLVPIPGLEAVSAILNMVLRAATRYLDKVIFSYNLARGDVDPWQGGREGVVYYAQNAKPILKQSVWVVILERALTVLLCLVMLIPAAAITLALPAAVRETGAVATLAVAVLLGWAIRGAFIKPLFLIMLTVRFHALVDGQPINAAWDERLSQMSDAFRNLGQAVSDRIGGAAFWRRPAPGL